MIVTDNEKNIMINLFKQLVINNNDFHKNEGIHFCLKLDVENLGFEKDGNTYHKDWEDSKVTFVHYIVTKPHSVYMAVSESIDMPSPETFKNTSNHNSCWCNDGFCDLFNIFMNMYDETHKNTPEEHRLAPVACSYHISLNTQWLSGPVFEFVKIETENKNSYHKNILKIEKIKKTITI